MNRSDVRRIPLRAAFLENGESAIETCGNGARLANEFFKHFEIDRLRTVRKRLIGNGVNFADDAICTGCDSRERHWNDEFAATGAVRGIDDDWK